MFSMTPANTRLLIIFFLSLTNSVQWHVAKGNKVGHLKHIVIVHRKACCQLELESEHLIFSPVA